MTTQFMDLGHGVKTTAPTASVGGWVRNRRHGERTQRPCLCLDDLLALISGGYRQEILRLLAEGPQCVSDIAESLQAPVRIISHQLAKLDEASLVCCRRSKSFRIYSLTDRVRALRKGHQIQLVVITEMRHWALIHIDEGLESEPPVAPPEVFVEGATVR